MDVYRSRPAERETHQHSTREGLETTGPLTWDKTQIACGFLFSEPCGGSEESERSIQPCLHIVNAESVMVGR